ncbi:MocR-like pyridoxine biosynthesis transcription factor PdxR [Anaerosporobacter sp.]|uniref:MocR-like pyridoxine biosynthesis transcription factor PdxR n=1 Tax=Anaerosporobacter sp. TaxID=1872529 RepID=UPI00286F9DB3|nr:PLP-dependent aminotransferase family protein [Anaerosporobacter sp.]
MLTYSFANIGSDSLYEHLYKCIKNDILQGILRPDDKLPSKRTFAKNLNISTITIENAYAQLLAEGYIYSIPKRGYFIANLDHSIQISQSTHLAEPEIETSFSKRTTDDNSATPFADFISNQTNPDNFPFSIWTKLMREIILDKSRELMTNSPCGGILELRTAIATHLKEFRNMDVSPEQIIVGAGTEYLYGLLIQLLGHDRIYGVEDPGYQKVAQIYRSNQVSCHYIPLDEHGIMIDGLDSNNIDIIHTCVSHHFPTGIITPISRRYELLGWASKSDTRYIIEDDYDSEFRLMGKPIPSLQSIDVMEKVIYMNTFTKSLASTIRISYMILPNHLVKKFYETLSFYSCTVSNFEQYTLARFIQGGYFEKHINRMRNYYRGQRDFIMECIQNNPNVSRITIKEEDSGLHFLMQVSTDKTDEVIVEEALKQGIRISCLSNYYHSNYYHNENNDTLHTLIINYSNLPPVIMQEAIDRLCNAIFE